MFVETLEVDAGTGRSIRSVYALDNGLTLPEKPLNETAFCDWIARARVGQAIQYHEGFLMLDRAEATSDLPAKDRTRLHAVARRAWIACELGLIHLFSQRVGDGHYRYFAVRSSTPLPSPDVRARLRVSTFNPHA